jgi:hypothetical protein
LGRIRANTVLLNWFDHPEEAEPERRSRYGRNLRTALTHHCNVIMLTAGEAQFQRVEAMAETERCIDVWCLDDSSGHLMLMLAYLMTRNDPWKDAEIRLLLVAENSPEQTLNSAREMLEEFRISAEPVVVDAADSAAVHRHSAGAAVVFLPFSLRDDTPVSRAGEDLDTLLEGLPLTALVLAAEGVDLAADTDTDD